MTFSVQLFTTKVTEQARCSSPLVIVLQMSAFGMVEPNSINSCHKVLAAVLVSACFFSNLSSQSYLPETQSLLESGRVFAFRAGYPIFQVMLPFHLEFNSQTRLCSRFNSRMALQYVEAVRLAADLVSNSSLFPDLRSEATKEFGIKRTPVGFIIMDTCSSVDRVMEHLKELQFSRKGICGLYCPGWRNSSKPGFPRYTIQSSAVRLVIGIESSAVVKATESFFEWNEIPLISHAAPRQPFSRRTLNLSTPTGKKQFARRERHVFDVFPEALEARAILDLIAFFNWTHVGVFAPLTEEAMAMYSNLQNNINTRTCFGIQVMYSTKDEESVFDAAEKIANVPLINAVILLGDLESSLPFIRAVSDLNAIDRLVWIMTSTWGKQAWGLPLKNPKYQVVAKMKHVFFLQPVPAGKKSVLGESWHSIACKLQERLRNGLRQPQENDPLFEFQKSLTAAKSSFFEVEDRNQGSGMLGSCLGAKHPEDGAEFSLGKHSFFLDNSLLLIDSFLQTARTASEILKARDDQDCLRKYVKSPFYCRLFYEALFRPRLYFEFLRSNGWFQLTDSQKKQAIRRSDLNNWGLFKNFPRGAVRSNLTGLNLDPINAKYSIYYMRRSEEKAALPTKFGHWIPSKVKHIRHSQILEIEAEMANILSSCPRNLTCPPGTRKVTFVNYLRRCCYWKTCAPCTGNSFSNTSNSAKCTKCERGHHPSKDHTTHAKPTGRQLYLWWQAFLRPLALAWRL